MSAQTAATPTSTGWKAELRDAFRDPTELGRYLELPAGLIESAVEGARDFPLLVPRAFAARMRKGDPNDPLLLQVLPTRAERLASPGFGPDPLAEQALTAGGCIQKYPGRALLITTGACPVHCRYCFRREFPYSAPAASLHDPELALEAIRQRPATREVILSGGDPLSLGNERLERLVTALEQLPGVSTLRIHTRFPIVLPARVDAGLAAILARSRFRVVIVLHSNHPAEIDEAVALAVDRLRECARYVLNQSVLLRGINDRADVLIRLSERLLDIGVTPYYLHLLDRVSGTQQFEVPADEALRLLAEMRSQTPGYLVPRLVRDEPGRLSKTLVG